MSQEYKHLVVIGTMALSLLAGLAMLFFHMKGYDTSIGWGLNSDSDLEEIVAYEFEKGPFEFQIKGEKITLTESFYGDKIEPLKNLTVVYLLFVFLGIGILMASATYLKQWGFLVFSVFFALFLTQLNLNGYFDAGQWIILIPFGTLIGMGFLFQSYLTSTPFLIRIGGILGVLCLLFVFMPGGIEPFTNHFFGHGTAPLMILGFLFLALVSEELLFGLLFFLTRTRGAKGNQKHLLLLGGIYIVNLAGYYFNKAGILDFTFTFMDPYLLLFISFCIAIWSYKYKYELTQRSVHFVPFLVSLLAMGLIVFSLLGLGFSRGHDGIYEGIHYLIIYTHLAFGFMFIAYIILNFIDPLINGFQIYKILYKPQTFHYVTARLGGLAMIAAFYFLSNQAAYNLFRSTKYSILGDAEMAKGKNELAISYYRQADTYGYNLHYPNYQLGSIYLGKNNFPMARNHFEKASLRHPSAQAFLNSSNLQRSNGLGLSTAILEQGLLEFPGRPQLINNLGIIHKKSGILDKALVYFQETKITNSWNQAPQANKWAVLSELRRTDKDNIEEAYTNGNAVVKTNVLSAMISSGVKAPMNFDSSAIYENPFPLHNQAYLLNATSAFADTTLQNQIELHLTSVFQVLQPQLKKAVAINMYLTGRVKQAFSAYDQLQLGKNGITAGTYLNEMGMLALNQHAPLQARDFFDKAIEAGHVPARLNKLVALLEGRRFAIAEQFLNELVKSDTVYAPLNRSLINAFNPNSDTTLEARINGVYYRCTDFEPEQLHGKMDEFSPEIQRMILNKLIQDLENNQDSASMQAYANSEFKLEFVDYSHLDRVDLISLARQQPFSERLALMATEFLKENDAIDAYNFLHETLDYNPYSIPLLKELALLALDINLPDYAEPALNTLSNLMTGKEFARFQKFWSDKQKNTEDDWSY